MKAIKRMTALTAAALLLLGSASADWTCDICRYTWQDGTDYCDECGFDAPINGLRVTNAGQDFIMLKWYGATTGHLTLLWCVSGTEQWQMNDYITGKSSVLSGLESGVSYDVQLVVDYDSVVGKVTAKTVGGTTPAPESKEMPGPTPTVTPEPTPAPTYEPAGKITIGDYTCWRENGTVSIEEYKGEAAEVSIPETLGGYPVTAVGAYAFYYCTQMTSVTIPDSVTSIGNGAFQQCINLKSITIPDSVTSIGNDAFRSCTSLTSITIPDSVTSIGRSAFSHCSGLQSVTIPNSVTSIGDDAFFRCSSLMNVTIPNKVTSIGKSAFQSCKNLTSVIIPDRTTSIGQKAFYGCSNLTSIIIPNSVNNIGQGAFRLCSKLTEITIPSSVNSIGKGTFGINITLYVTSGSYAQQYAKENKVKYQVQ